MTDEKWASAYDLFNEASRLPPERRRAFVENASVGPEIILRVLELLDDADANADANEVSRVGTRIGRYVIIDRLGRGGMGEVYSARDTELDRIVALKFLSPELQGPHLVERFIREAKAASALNHPNIVTVYEVAQSESGQAIAMEFVDGRAIREYCGAPVPAGQVAAWGRQIAEALAAAHARGIVHRDIKPENLMVRGDGYVKVLDFGLARREMPGAWSNSTNFSGVFGGTLSYMSPEQTRGARATSASDLFSLGIVLFELATGKHPFAADSPIDTAHAIAHAAPRLSPEIPPTLAACITSMLAKDPAKRASAEEVERRLVAIGADATKKRRISRLWLTASALAVCVTGSWGLWMVQERIFPPKEPVIRQVTMQASENRVTAAALSPDGKLLAFAGAGEPVQLRQLTNGYSRAMLTPEGLNVVRIAWFADCSKLLVSGVSGGNQPGIWVMPVNGGKPALVVPGGENGVPSPDGTRVAFTSGDGATIWVVEMKRGNPRQIRGGGGAGWFSALVWSPDGKRISYQRREYAPPRDRQVHEDASRVELNYAYSYESADGDTGRVIASARDIWMTSAFGLLDGRVLYLSPVSSTKNFRKITATDGVEQQLYELPTNPLTGKILGSPRRLTHRADQGLSSLSATNDGNQVAVVWWSKKPNIYIADLPRGDVISKLLNVRRLTFTLASDYPHGWTLDSRAVIFESSRNGKFDLFRQHIDRKEAEPLVVSAIDKVLAQVSPDGRWVLYREDPEQHRAGRTLMRVPVEGGQPEEIPTAGNFDEFRCSLRTGSRCVLRSIENDQFVFYDLDPVRGQGRELARTVWSPTVVGDWDISPDGLVVAIPNHDPHNARIRTVQLEGSRADMAERTLMPEGLKNLSGLVWAPNGLGWYVCARAPAGSVLSFVDLQGHSRELLQLPGPTFAVPSPDGRHVALPQYTVSSNVWMIEQFRSGRGLLYRR
jgi:eukaryotic-like serine/threonine-protein kinase